jgi:hypothetical protein
MNAQMPKKNRDDSQVGSLLEKKFAASAKIAALKAEIAQINSDMVKVGASTDEIACL